MSQSTAELISSNITTDDPAVYLRHYIPDDATALFEAIDEDRAHLSNYGEPTGTSAAYQSIETTRQEIITDLQHSLRFGMWRGARLIGNFSIYPLKDYNAAKIGCWVRASETRRGYAKLGVKALAHYAFIELDFDFLNARVNPKNIASQRVLASIGFRKLDGPESIMLYRLFRQDVLGNG